MQDAQMTCLYNTKIFWNMFGMFTVCITRNIALNRAITFFQYAFLNQSLIEQLKLKIHTIMDKFSKG